MTKDSQKAIYVLVYRPQMGDDQPEEAWEVVRWLEHPALAPHSGSKQNVSTAAGDVELRVPPLAERNYRVLGRAHQRIEQLHPRPENLSPETLSNEALLSETLHLSLEYIALAEDGRGNNARSHYLAAQLLQIQQYLVCLNTKEENNG